MAGHSKWSNIKHKKKKQDKKKAKLFGKLVKEITVEARKNPDPEENPTLASAIERAKDANMPKENIERAIKRATGELEDVEYKIQLYEGYGPGSTAVLIKAITDNRNRTSTKLKNIFEKYGGELGEDGCVKWMFTRKGVVTLEDRELGNPDADTLQLEAIDRGAEAIDHTNGKVKLYCQPDDLEPITEYLEECSLDFTAKLVMLPQSEKEPDEETRPKVEEFLEELRDYEDVEEIYTNIANSTAD